MKKAINRMAVVMACAITWLASHAQVGIGTVTPHASAKLDVTSTNKGFLAPRVALTGTADVSTIASPATSLLVYNTATAGSAPNNVIPGFYYYNGTAWVNLITTATSGVPYTGATGAVNLGAYDLTVNQAIVGLGAGAIITNTAMGQVLNRNTTGSQNTAIGYGALYLNTTGAQNTAGGYQALFSNTTGGYNTATGSSSLLSNTTGGYNTATGYQSLYNNSTGINNTGHGYYTLFGNTTGSNNTAAGLYALSTNTTGSGNTVFGFGADVASNNLGNATAIGNGAIVSASNKIQLGNTSVTNVKTSGTITAGAITLPNTDGTNGQVLSTNGSGVVSWGSGSGVPYSGATGAVNLGAYDLSVNGLTVGRGLNAIASNTSIGSSALSSNTTGSYNVANGYVSLISNTTGTDNTSIGAQAMNNNQTGSSNTAVGLGALYYNSTNSGITAIGWHALHAEQGAGNAALGYAAGARGAIASTLTNSTFLGNSASAGGGTIDNATAIGNGAIVAASNTIQLGNTSVTNVNTNGTINLATGTATKAALQFTSGVNLTTPVSGAIEYDGTNLYYTNSSAARQTLATSATGVPYTGAIAAVNLGAYDLTVNGLTIGLGHGNVTGNTALGTYSLPRNTTAANNTAIGYGTLNSNTSGYNNTALGSQTLQGNSTGNNNTGIGEEAIQGNTTGNNNTATGFETLFLNATGNSNTAMGYNSLWKNSSTSYNTGIGQGALYQNTGSNNTGIGVNVIAGNSTGSNNVGLGYNAGLLDMNNLNTSVFDNSVFLGANSKMHADGETNQIVIGYNAIGNGSNTIQLGNTSITSVVTSGTVTANGTTLSSDKRLKTNIIPVSNALAIVMKLNPVHYDKKNSMEATAYGKTENGFIAQEIQKVLPFIVKEGTDKDKLLSVDYNSIIPILTKGMQEQQVQIASQQKQINELKAMVEKLLKEKK